MSLVLDSSQTNLSKNISGPTGLGSSQNDVSVSAIMDNSPNNLSVPAGLGVSSINHLMGTFIALAEQLGALFLTMVIYLNKLSLVECDRREFSHTRDFPFSRDYTDIDFQSLQCFQATQSYNKRSTSKNTHNKCLFQDSARSWISTSSSAWLLSL